VCELHSTNLKEFAYRTLLPLGAIAVFVIVATVLIFSVFLAVANSFAVFVLTLLVMGFIAAVLTAIKTSDRGYVGLALVAAGSGMIILSFIT